MSEVDFQPGSAVPRYVERLDEVEWVTDRRREPTVVQTLALVAIVVGLMGVVIGLIMYRSEQTSEPGPAITHHRKATPEEERAWSDKLLEDTLQAQWEAAHMDVHPMPHPDAPTSMRTSVPDPGVRPVLDPSTVVPPR